MPRHVLPLAVAGLCALAGVSAQQQAPQRQQAPKWLDDEGKDLFADLEADDNPHALAACEVREKLLKKMAGKGEQDAAQQRARVLFGLALCEFSKQSWTMAKKRLESGISELNLPNEEMMLKHKELAHYALLKQAAVAMDKFEVTQAATAMRRARETIDRHIKNLLKAIHKSMTQQGQQAPPLERMNDERYGYGKTGDILPMLMTQVPGFKSELAMAEVVDKTLAAVDTKMAATDTSLKDKRIRMDISRSKEKGSLMYVRALATEAVVPAERVGAAQELLDGKIAKLLKEEVAALEKGATLLKRTKPGSGCKEGKGLDKTCKLMADIADISSNGFGETRIVMVKANKPSPLDVCNTNANVAILIAAKDGVSVALKGVEGSTTLEEGVPVTIDFCKEATLTSASAVPVLFAQAWHPEFAGLERTTEMRSRATAFGLSEDDVKATTKIINDHAKKQWEKSAKLWREGSDWHASLKAAFQGSHLKKKQEEEDAKDAKRKEDEAGDEERKENIAKLEQKRKQQAAAKDAALEKKKETKRKMEEERANLEPWLKFPAIRQAETHLAELKVSRREANAQLEFDASAQLTKDISKAERDLKKITKKAKKEYKKTGAIPAEGAESASSKSEGKAAKKEGSELTGLQDELKKVKEQKAAASEAENFKEAKKLKKKQQELEDKISKLEL